MDDKLVNILLEIKEDTASTRTAVAALRSELFDEGGRVYALEENVKTQDSRYWYQTAVIIPALALIHAGLRKAGLNI